jgi:UDP-glucuronate 4-epimerase
MKILVTGVAGFIGMHVSLKLIEMGHQIVGVDNINDYYSVQLKRDRLNLLHEKEEFQFHEVTIEDEQEMHKIFKISNVDLVINLAAQPGVRYSLDNPGKYINSNVNGFMNILECCRNFQIKHLIYASSSSVYGSNTNEIHKETDCVEMPLSIYAATKKANELMAYSYSHLFKIKTIGLRFFTVYGPWGRPDMSPAIFTESIINNRPINIHNNGEMQRDFTYIDDIVDGICGLIKFQNINKILDNYSIFNIGNNKPVTLLEYIETLESVLNKDAIKNYVEIGGGEMLYTNADISRLNEISGYNPKTSLLDGLKKYSEWYKSYHV